VVVLLLAGCHSGGDSDGGNNGTVDGGTGGLGPMIDRMGRPAVSTALIGTFRADEGSRNTIKDSYNVAPESQWQTLFKAEIASNLAIYDGLDKTCGNQFPSGGEQVPGRYDTLASVLADDKLYVNTPQSTCSATSGYLAVETGLTTDCGGRVPTADVIDVSYGVLAGEGTVVSDNVPEPGEVDMATFPFLGAPR
jgi:hypothetical protein